MGAIGLPAQGAMKDCCVMLKAIGGLVGWLGINPRRVGQLIDGVRVRRLESALLLPSELVLVTVGAAGGRSDC